MNQHLVVERRLGEAEHAVAKHDFHCTSRGIRAAAAEEQPVSFFEFAIADDAVSTLMLPESRHGRTHLFMLLCCGRRLFDLGSKPASLDSVVFHCGIASAPFGVYSRRRRARKLRDEVWRLLMDADEEG